MLHFIVKLVGAVGARINLKSLRSQREPTIIRIQAQMLTGDSQAIPVVYISQNNTMFEGHSILIGECGAYFVNKISVGNLNNTKSN